ncbi:MAG: glycosyltransferase family 39 protein [Proteobacteria bacterium]|nr:glycosyltransferase family 39 protein [Pseudomonadota bacterium]MBU1060629.1 glycosyltransferase family 39 protein [Pseudomonadota bacterium]
MTTRIFHTFFLGVILFTAAVLLVAGSWFSYTSTFDTATVGLMSVNIVQGDRPLFFYGQPYFGALEAYLAALYIAVFGFSEFVVSLSPISFTLAWIVFSYLLFSRIHNRTAGLVAAACTAFPGYYVFWYSIATYGGYSAILCLGTAILWLSLRMFQENEEKVTLVFHSVCLGFLMALAIWIHALTFPYLVIAAGILGCFVLKERFRLDIVLSLGIAALIALSGFLPFYFETGSFLGGISERSQISWAVIEKALATIFSVNIYELVVWNFSHTFQNPLLRYVLPYGSLSILFIAVLLALHALFSKRERGGKQLSYLIPFFFCLLFLMMYVQHHMATVKAPRYTINFLSMFLCMVWASAVAGQTKRSLKIVSSTLFCLWIGYQVAGTVLFIVGGSNSARMEQKIARDIVAAAHEKHLKSVVTYGDYLFGLKGQKLSMYSQNEIVFAHADTERYQANAQFTETDRSRGYLCTEADKVSLENTLKELRVNFSVDKIHNYFLFSNLQATPQLAMQAIAKEEIQFIAAKDETGELIGELLVDRYQDDSSELMTLAGKSLTFDTGKKRKLCGLWMFTAQDPSLTEWQHPGQYELSVSEDGTHYQKIHSSLANIGNGFHAGPHIYIGGPWGKVEALFSPVMARYVKITFSDKSISSITELFLFETDGRLRPDSPDDIIELKKLIIGYGLDFVLADRWLSARLREVFTNEKRKDISLPRLSTKYKNNPLHYFVRPAQGQALVCDMAVADECEKVLIGQYGKSVISKRVDLQNYALFILADAETSLAPLHRQALLWNGHFPLQTKDMRLLAPWFHAQGLPIWRKDFTKTSNFYHDCWTDGDAKLLNLNYTLRQGKDKELVLYTHGWRPGNEMANLQLRVIANEKTSLTFKQQLNTRYVFSLPKTLVRLDSLEIQSTTFVPPGQDSRRLGVDVQRVEIQ